MLAGATAVLAAIASWVFARSVRRRRRDEIRSVHHYHDRLDTLHVEPHDRGGSVRLVDEPDPSTKVLVERPRVEFDPNWHAEFEATPPDGRRRKARSWALDRTQPRARVDTTTMVIVAIVLVALGALALAGYLLRTDHGEPPTGTSHPGAVAGVRGSSAVASWSGLGWSPNAVVFATTASWGTAMESVVALRR